METLEAVFAMLEIVAVMLPLSLIALGLIVRWLRETDDARVLGPEMVLTVGDIAGFTLMLLSGAGIALSFHVMGHGSAPSSVRVAGVLALLAFCIFGVLGFAIHLRFEDADEDDAV